VKSKVVLKKRENQHLFQC